MSSVPWRRVGFRNGARGVPSPTHRVRSLSDRTEWIQGVPEAALLLNSSGMVEAANPEALRRLGMRSSSILGRSVAHILPGLHLTPPARGGSTVVRLASRLRPSETRARRDLEVRARHFRVAGAWRTMVLLRETDSSPPMERETDPFPLHVASMFRASPLGTCVLDAAGRGIFTNAAWRRLTGLSRIQCLGAGWSRMVHPDDRPPLREAWRRARAGSSIVLHEYRLVRPDGGVRWISARMMPLNQADGRGRGCLILNEDVTARHDADSGQRLAIEVSSVLGTASTLREVVPRLLKVIAKGLGTDVGEFWTSDARADRLRVEHVWHTNSRQLNAFVRHSRTLDVPLFNGLPGRVLRSGRAEWVPQLDLDVPLLRGREATRAGLRSALALPVPFHGRVVGVMAFLGRTKHKPAAGHMRLLGAVTRQIGEFMERERTANALRASEVSLLRAQAMVGLGSYEQPVDIGGRITWSPEVFAILGLTPRSSPLAHDELLARVVHPDDRTRVRELVRRALRGHQAFDLEFRVRRPNGSTRHVQTRAEFTSSKRGGLRSVVGTLWDITERKELQRGILEAAEREQQRLGRDLHDGIGQRLTALELFSETLAADLEGAEPRLLEAAYRMTRELRITLAQTRMLSHGLSPVPLEADGLARALRELTVGVTKLSGVRCEFLSARPVILPDPSTATHLYRIAQEAVTNAIRHSRARRVVVRLDQRSDRVDLTIADDGHGLRRHVVSSEGIGLRVMRFRSDLIGATLELKSTPRRGTRIHCILRPQS